MKKVKEYSFNLFTEILIVEDRVAVILPPQPPLPAVAYLFQAGILFFGIENAKFWPVLAN